MTEVGPKLQWSRDLDDREARVVLRTNLEFWKWELRSGETMFPGDMLISPNGQVVLSFRKDGNLVLIHVEKDRRRELPWSSNTANRNIEFAQLTADGDFVVCDEDSNIVKLSYGRGEGDSVLAVQDDGNICIYKGGISIPQECTWASHTWAFGVDPKKRTEWTPQLLDDFLREELVAAGTLKPRKFMVQLKRMLPDKVCQFLTNQERQKMAKDKRILREKWRYPVYFINCISLVQLILSAHHYCNDDAEPRLMEDDSKTYGICASLEYNPRNRLQVWRLFTAMLLHDSYEHLMSNMVGQYLMGGSLEMLHGSGRVALVYLGGGMIGCLGASMLYPTFRLFGASCGIYALSSAHMVGIFTNWTRIGWPWPLYLIRRPGLLKGRILSKVTSAATFRVILLIIYIVWTDGATLAGLIAGDGDQSISFASHGFGFLGGAVVAGAFLTRSSALHADLGLRSRLLLFRWFCGFLIVEFLIFALFWNLFASAYPKS